jgi:hypothetical protein
MLRPYKGAYPLVHPTAYIEVCAKVIAGGAGPVAVR